MKRSELEKYLGKTVKITLYDGVTISGELHKTGEERFKNDLSLYLKQNLYFLMPVDSRQSGLSSLFRCTYVKRLEEV